MGTGEAGYYTRENGAVRRRLHRAPGDPRGLLLVGIGLVTLWSSRSGGERGSVATCGALLPSPSCSACTSRLPGRHRLRRHAHGAGVRADAELGAPHEDVAFTTSDGLRLEGWYVPSRNGATVIVFPGRRGRRRHAQDARRHGYGVLLFDRRGEGESEGDPNAFGWAGKRDVQAALAFLRSRPEVDDDRIGGIGLSVGGEMILQAAAETDGLKAVVSEGAGIRSVREAADLRGGTLDHDRWWSADDRWDGGLRERPASAGLKDLSAEISEPALFIYATPGQGGENLTPTYYEAAKGAEAALGGRRRAHGRDRRRAGGVRAAGRRLLRRRLAGR